MGANLYLLFLYVGAPIGIAKWIIGASWAQIGIAYAAWLGALSLWAALGLLQGLKPAEAIGWPIIFGMFLSIPAITLLTIGIRLLGWTLRASG